MMKMYHTFHIVSLSPWPLLNGILVFFMMTSFIVMFKMKMLFGVFLSFFLMMFLSFLWWRDVTRESCFIGDHSMKVQDGLKWGMSLFIFSEVLFFFAWFWAFFHHSLVPTQETGNIWPPTLINPFDPFSIPLLNTCILVSSGVFVTWAHHNMLMNKNIFFAFFLTIFFGVVFTFFQLFEYSSSLFSISDGAYGTIFFVSTGFHGLHVLIGSVFLLVCLLRILKNQMVFNHHIGFEFSIWYWHFVDVVWLFLFSFIYWWGL